MSLQASCWLGCSLLQTWLFIEDSPPGRFIDKATWVFSRHGTRSSPEQVIQERVMPLHTQAVLLWEPRSCLTDWFTRALWRCRGQEQTCACGSAFAWERGPPSSPPGSGARALREDHPQVLFSLLPGLEAECSRCGKAGLLHGRSGSQPGSACKSAFGINWGGLPAGEGQFCSEARNARVRAQHGPCPWPALQRHSWLQVVLPLRGRLRDCVRHARAPSWGQLR